MSFSPAPSTSIWTSVEALGVEVEQPVGDARVGRAGERVGDGLERRSRDSDACVTGETSGRRVDVAARPSGKSTVTDSGASALSAKASRATTRSTTIPSRRSTVG